MRPQSVLIDYTNYPVQPRSLFAFEERESMRTKRFNLLISTMVVAALAVILGMRSAGATPRELYNKGIRIEYSVATTEGGRDVVTNVSRTIYVSSAGRLFERVVWSNRAGREISDNTPSASSNSRGEARDMSFRGNILVARIGYAAGAGQMTIRFDPGFSSCEGGINFGTEAGKAMVRWNMRGNPSQITSIKASNVACSVTPGNPLQ
jgi:hypothetical protein